MRTFFNTYGPGGSELYHALTENQFKNNLNPPK